jgi:hypothetical protein
MDRIRFLAIVRAVRQHAARWGYRGDILTDAGRVPMVGTYGQQLAIMTIAADVRPRPASDEERRLLSRLVRAAVLTSPAPAPHRADDRAEPPDAITRASRHAVIHRRQQRRRTRG